MASTGGAPVQVTGRPPASRPLVPPMRWSRLFPRRGTPARYSAAVAARAAEPGTYPRRTLSERLVSYKLPHTFEFVTEPVRDDAGKVRRSALRRQGISLTGLARPRRYRGGTYAAG